MMANRKKSVLRIEFITCRVKMHHYIGVFFSTLTLSTRVRRLASHTVQSVISTLSSMFSTDTGQHNPLQLIYYLFAATARECDILTVQYTLFPI